MKIIRIDNYGRGGNSPGYDDLHISYVTDIKGAEKIVGLLNEHTDGEYMYKLVVNGYELEVFKP